MYNTRSGSTRKGSKEHVVFGRGREERSCGTLLGNLSRLPRSEQPLSSPSVSRAVSFQANGAGIRALGR